MNKQVKYLIDFPIEEFEASNAHEAIIQACEYYKKNTLKVKWKEIKENE